MSVHTLLRPMIVLSLAVSPVMLAAQGAPPSPRADSNRTASRLDSEGQTAKAREVFQALIDGAPSAAAKAASQRAMAMSYAFDGECKSTVRYEEMVMAYWVTRE